MLLCRGAEKEILKIIKNSLKDGNESGFRSGFKSERNRDEDRSRGAYDGGSNSGGSRGSGGSSNYGSGQGHEDESSGSQAKSFSLDDYEILGLPKTATLSDVKKQFRKLALEHHPGCLVNCASDDLNSNIDIFFTDKNMHLTEDEVFTKQELMKRINSAYAVLGSKINS